nr:exodeoxyribonuclease 1 [Quercus suber]
MRNELPIWSWRKRSNVFDYFWSAVTVLWAISAMGIQGQTLGVDAYGWLHRGIFACAVELAQEKPTRRHIDFTLNRVRMLIHFGVKPYIVLDGDNLPSKAHTEKERAAKRKESKRLGLEFLRTGRESQAQIELQKAVDVTPLMARELIEELKLLGVPYIVAPYEADSQLVYLEKQGIISGIVSEDSDLLVFGAKCLLTKLDQYGECMMVNRADFTACTEVSLVGWSDQEFRMMAMLAGCDYLPNISHMGVKTAYRLIRKHKNIEDLIRNLQFDGKKKVPADYLENFTKAERTFLYQWVFCPEAKCLLNLTKVPPNLSIDSMPFIGRYVDPDTASGVAAGELDPNTKERIHIESRQSYAAGRRNVVQTPDEKPGKSITEFFKPKRTPLAELDPNSFTPSPSQQRLLQEQNTNSWSASQIPIVSPVFAPIPDERNQPSSAPQATRRGINEQLHASRNRPSPKRQRLCSESALANYMKGNVEPTGKSRFFQHNVNPSPTLRNSSAQLKLEDFDLWSDDPAAHTVTAVDALREKDSCATTPLAKKRQKLQVYEDGPVAGTNDAKNASVAENTQSTIMTPASAGAGNTTCGTPDTSSYSKPQHSVFSDGVNANFAALKSSFTHKPAEPGLEPLTVPSALRLTSKKVVQTRQEDWTLQQTRSAPASTSHRDPDVREQEEDTSGTIVPCSSPPMATEEGFGGGGRSKDNRPQTSSPIRYLGPGGSEDMLIPASPCSEEGDDGRRRPTFDLARFAFTG